MNQKIKLDILSQTRLQKLDMMKQRSIRNVLRRSDWREEDDPGTRGRWGSSGPRHEARALALADAACALWTAAWLLSLLFSWLVSNRPSWLTPCPPSAKVSSPAGEKTKRVTNRVSVESHFLSFSLWPVEFYSMKNMADRRRNVDFYTVACCDLRKMIKVSGEKIIIYFQNYFRFSSEVKTLRSERKVRILRSKLEFWEKLIILRLKLELRGRKVRTLMFKSDTNLRKK